MAKSHPFGEYLRETRENARMTLRQVAQALEEQGSEFKLHYVYLSQVERGVERPMNEKYYAALAAVIPGLSETELRDRAKVSRPIELDLRQVSPEVQALGLALARKIQSGMTEEEARRLLSSFEDFEQ